MRVFKVGNSKYATDLTGEGARLHGGRWNHPGIRCVYTSQTRALAVLEFSVNVNTERILRYLSMIEIEIPDDIQEITRADLPGDWREVPAPASTKNFGTSLINAGSKAIIKIASAVIPQEFNFLINPQHPLSANCRIIEVTDFVYDIRIKTAK